MALSDRDIIITPNRGASTEPTILFRGADASTSASITLRVLNSGTIGTLSFEGTSGQLFSLTDTLSGSIFTVNDISGIPSIEVLDTGLVKLAQYAGNVQIGGTGNQSNATSTTTGELQVVGGAGIWKDLYIGGNINIGGTVTAGSINVGSAVTSATNVTVTNDPSSGSIMYPTFVNSTSGIAGIRVDSDGLVWVPSSNRLGIGITSPSTNLHVYAATDPVITLQAGGGSYPYMQLTTPSSGTGYLIKNIGTGNSVLNQSLYLYNNAAIQFVTNNTPASAVTIDTGGRLGVGTGGQPTLYTPVSVGNPNHISPGQADGRILNWWAGSGGTELYNSVHGISVGHNSAATDQPQYVGLHLFNPNATANNWSPMLAFGGLSTSGGYMNASVGMAAQLRTNTADGNFRSGDLHFWLQNTDTNGRGFNGSTTSRIVFAGTGNNGFGTTNPQTKLHLLSSGETVLRIDGASGTGNAVILLTDTTNPTGEGMRITYASSAGDTYFNNIYTPVANAFHFQSGAFGSGTELLTITTAGNLLKKGVVVPSLTVSDNAPSSPFDNDLWWESDTGRLKVRYNDGSSVQWVDALPIPDVSNFYSKAGGIISGPVVINGTLDVSGLASFNNVYVAGTITAGSIVGSSISASTIAVTNDSATASSFYPTFVSGTGTPALRVDTSKFIYRPSDGRLTLGNGVVAPSGIFGATTGAPDARIWSISADQYPNWGLFYNEGSPDYIEFQTGGTVTSRISLDSGDAHFGLSGGSVGINTGSPATKLNILQGAGDATYGTAALRIGGTSNYASLELGIKGAYDGMISTYGNDLHIYAGNWRGVGNTASENHTIFFYTSQNGSTNWNTPKWQMQTTGQFVKGSYPVPSIAVSDSAPTGMFDGDFWWESDTGRLKIRYNDGSSTQWVDAVPFLDSAQFYPRGGGAIYGSVSVNGGLTVSAFITAGGEITAYYSDRRLKTNVAPIQNALGKVLKLNGITYNPNEVAGKYGYDTNVNIVGLFADEVEAVLPEAVKPAPFDTDEEGNSKSGENYKTVQYEKLVPLLVEAMKDQQKIIDGLQTKITELEKLIGKSN